MRMNSPTVTYLALVFLVISFSCANAADLPVVAPADVNMSAEKLERVGQIVNKFIGEKQLAGASVIVARKGQVCFFETYGMMDVERDKPMQKDTIFRIYSMSKAITTAAVMQLVEQGKVSPADPIGNYIPELKSMNVFTSDGIKPAKNPITVAQLMTHTSGLVYGAQGEYGELIKTSNALSRENTIQEMTQKMGQTPLKFEPGTDWEYGTSIDVLGRLVEVVSGQPFDDYLKEHIFTPLDMHDTAFFVPAEKLNRFAAMYKQGGELEDDPAASDYLNQPALKSGGGGLVGTITDYMKFLIAIRNGGTLNGQRILKQTTVELMTQNHVSKDVGWIKFGETVRDGIGFGYGFDVTAEKSQFDPARKVGDYGWGGAASTHYWVSPQDDLIVVTMEQTKPYSFRLEDALKPVITEAIE